MRFSLSARGGSRALSRLETVRQARRLSTQRPPFLRVHEEVEDALKSGKPVVALETTIYTHGYPYPDNVSLSSRLESLVRVNGGIPATIGILDGVAYVGMEPEEIIRLVSTAGNDKTLKVSRRDLAYITGLGLRGRKLNGGTTISGTMVLAHLAGIKVFATGGLGGVHRGGEDSMDVSADLTELGRTPVAVIASGCKSILDIGRTIEYLETQGVSVGTFADGRPGKVDFPAFWARDSGFKSPLTIQDEVDAAAMIYAQSQLPVHSGLFFANPVPVESALQRDQVDGYIAQAVAEAEQQAITGSANTPFLLKRIRELSKGVTVTANTALVEANVIRGTRIAVELAKLEKHGSYAQEGVTVSGPVNAVSENNVGTTKTAPPQVDILVAGAIASDTLCDYAPFVSSSDPSPVLQTSNPASIAQSSGGVGRNVTLAAHYAGAKVALAGVVADDIAGQSLIEHMARGGFVTDYIRTLKTTDGARTAQYVAVNDAKKDLVLAMADMSILTRPELEQQAYWDDVLQKAKPKYLVIDGNWSARIMSTIFASARANGVPVPVFEPVSTAKSITPFDKEHPSIRVTRCFPSHDLAFATPNQFELRAMHTAARERGYFDSQAWWTVIDSFGLSSLTSRDRFISVTSPELVDQGIPQQCMQLLPYIPSIVTKLGSQGCLLTEILPPNDPKLRDPDTAPYIVARCFDGETTGIGGVYMRMFPVEQDVPAEDVVSVNGIGDTMLGVIMSSLAHEPSLERAISRAQYAAMLSLKSPEAVSPKIQELGRLTK